jgi:transcription initiation factor TFIID subunit 5
MVVNDDPIDADNFLREFRDRFEKLHSDELRTLSTIKLRQHAFENSLSNLYRTSKYRIPLNEHLFHNLLSFLEANGKEGGTAIIYLLQTYCEIRTTTRGPLDKYSFDAITNQSHGTSQEPDFQEGIPGAFTGVTNKDIMDNKAVLKLGMMPMEPELAVDVRAALDEEDLLNPPELGRPSLVEEFDRAIKREGSEGPSRNEIPLPASRARDVVMEIQKVKEYRDRFKIEGRTGGIGPAVSVCMFTFHNTYDWYVRPDPQTC